jgi:hypothetical protein
MEEADLVNPQDLLYLTRFVILDFNTLKKFRGPFA